MHKLPIRHFCKESDLERVKAFFAQMGGESRGLFNRGRGNEINALNYFDDSKIEKTKNTVYFMALDDDKMAAYLFLWDIHKSIIWLGIAVAEDWKGKGLGRELMAYADEYAKSHNKGGIFLTTSHANIRGINLYEGSGYEYLGVHISGEMLFIKRY